MNHVLFAYAANIFTALSVVTRPKMVFTVYSRLGRLDTCQQTFGDRAIKRVNMGRPLVGSSVLRYQGSPSGAEAIRSPFE